MTDVLALLPALRTLAREAGDAILDVYGSDFTVKNKDDASPVTEADVRAEKIILAGLAQLTPAIPVVSEEAAAAGVQVDISNGVFWLVDPLDGTKEFVKRNGEFTVNIGLISNGRPIAGVLFAPVLNRLFLAGPGIATVEDPDTAPRPIHVRRPPTDGLVVLGSRSHKDSPALGDFLKQFPVREMRNSGSSLKFALVAAGEADMYPRFGPTMEWDTAAGHAVLNAAGGCLTLPDGQPLVYGKPRFANPEVVAWGSAEPRPQGDNR